MATHDTETTLSFTSNSRRSLITTLCAKLNAALAASGQWEREPTLYPWQATSDSFERLPKRVVDVVMEGWHEANHQLDEIECSGYMETDEGSRAWGFIAVHQNSPPVEIHPIIDKVSVTVSGSTYQCEVRMHGVPVPMKDHNA